MVFGEARYTDSGVGWTHSQATAPAYRSNFRNENRRGDSRAVFAKEKSYKGGNKSEAGDND